MTLLATVSNLGGTFPRLFVLKLVDALTVASCVQLPAAPSEPFSCALEGDKHKCKDLGGTCQVYTDGYYMTNIVCVVVGIISFVWYIRPKVEKLMALPLRAWRDYD